MTWLCTGDIENASELTDISRWNNDNVREAFYKQFLFLAKCYLLGFELRAEQFYNHVMDALIIRCKEHGDKFLDRKDDLQLMVQSIWCFPRSVPLLRALVVDNLISTIELGISTIEPGFGFASIFDNKITPHEFLGELSLRAIFGWRNDKELLHVWEKDRCVYHRHHGQPKEYSCSSTKNGVPLAISEATNNACKYCPESHSLKRQSRWVWSNA